MEEFFVPPCQEQERLYELQLPSLAYYHWLVMMIPGIENNSQLEDT
jgi:hypothetical protein